MNKDRGTRNMRPYPVGVVLILNTDAQYKSTVKARAWTLPSPRSHIAVRPNVGNEQVDYVSIFLHVQAGNILSVSPTVSRAAERCG